MKKNILIIAPRKSTPFNEAWSKKILFLSKMIKATVIATGTQKEIIKRYKTYLIIKDISLLYSLFLFFVIYYVYFKKPDKVILAANPTNFYTRFLAWIVPSSKLILNFRGKTNIRPALNIKKIKHFLVENEESYVKIASKNLDVFFWEPVVDLQKYKYFSLPLANKSFTFLFASAPLFHHKYPRIFKTKGIFLLLDAFKKVNISNKKLILIWRSAYIKKLKEYIKNKKIKNVQVVNKMIVMDKYFKSANVTVLVPSHEIANTPEYPLSILESLACGRPVILSKKFDLSKHIQQYECGIVCSPNRKDLLEAMIHIFKNYCHFQKNTLNFRREYLEQINLSKIKTWLDKP